MDIEALVNLTSRAWSLPILARLHEDVPGRQAPLLAATGAGRTAFGQSMTHLIDLGLVERNPGHGHPLRPEFRLTERGKGMAAMAHRVLSISGERDQSLLRRAWTLPVLTTLQQPRHFTGIRRDLGGITDRALSQSLQSLEERDWVRRSISETARPLRPVYSAVNAGEAISGILI